MSRQQSNVPDEERPTGGPRKRKKRKPYLIMSRVPTSSAYERRKYPGLFDWSVWGRYETQEQRDEAFARLRYKSHLLQYKVIDATD